MNDRYLYRAKRKDNGEWISGYLYGIWERKYILWGMINDVPDMKEVDPSTICQCTGLKDKNGKLIWENDVVDIQNYVAKAHKVKWGYGGFYVGINGLLCHYNTVCEVIGNIFDNAELLEK